MDGSRNGYSRHNGPQRPRLAILTRALEPHSTPFILWRVCILVSLVSCPIHCKFHPNPLKSDPFLLTGPSGTANKAFLEPCPSAWKPLGDFVERDCWGLRTRDLKQAPLRYSRFLAFCPADCQQQTPRYRYSQEFLQPPPFNFILCCIFCSKGTVLGTFFEKWLFDPGIPLTIFPFLPHRTCGCFGTTFCTVLTGLLPICPLRILQALSLEIFPVRNNSGCGLL